MELRNTERELNEMLIVYESLRRFENTSSLSALDLPEAHPSLALVQTASLAAYPSNEQALKALEGLRSKLAELEARAQNFQKRLGEKDPISDTPRYGEKTATRVTDLLALYELLKRATCGAFERLELGGDPPIVAILRESVLAEQEAERQAKLVEEEQARTNEVSKRVEEEKRRFEEQRERRMAEETRRREEAELAQRANEVREAARRARKTAVQTEREWIDSIPTGPEGVRKQIEILKDDTKDDPAAQKVALRSLLTFFAQIAKDPEDISFRRVRRDHPQFHEDIGRHKGGREILIAAGFKLAKFDEVPVYFSQEPDLERDLDGWSLWFDNIRANLEVVKEMQ